MASSNVLVAAIGGRQWSTEDGWLLQQQRNGLWMALAPEDRLLPPLFAESMRGLVWLIASWQSTLRTGRPVPRTIKNEVRRKLRGIEGQMEAAARREAVAAQPVTAAAQEPISSRAQAILQRRRERAAAQLEAS
jgi:hypothetical protein